MNIQGEPVRKGSADAGDVCELLGARLRKLRRERRLIEKAIQALSEISRVRRSRSRRRASF